ncbi:MAG: hypothetical protein HGB08_02985 [Candidatus Moranbacteria bacterium]|nr:hypothetical protein [Candidatus Moranbacteria bacterium]
MNKKIIPILVLVSLAVLGVIGYLLAKLDNVAQDAERTTTVINIARQASMLSEENFHTQLELWEYINDPNEERLNAFKEHEKTLSDNLDNLSRMIGDGDAAAIYDGGFDDLSDISDNWSKINGNWQGILTAAKEYNEAVANSGLKGYALVSNPSVYEKLMAMRQLTFENEKIFDEINFDGKMRKFIILQDEYATNTRKASIEELYVCQNISLGLAILYLVLLFFIAVWLAMTIRMIKKKSADICKI